MNVRFGQPILDAALAYLLDQAGGRVAFDQATFLAIRARRGPFRIEGSIDKKRPQAAGDRHRARARAWSGDRSDRLTA